MQVVGLLTELGIKGWPALLVIALGFVVRKLWNKTESQYIECKDDREKITEQLGSLRADLDAEKEVRRDIQVKLAVASAPCGITDCPKTAQ